jgi:hypothetical protein
MIWKLWQSLKSKYRRRRPKPEMDIPETLHKDLTPYVPRQVLLRFEWDSTNQKDVDSARTIFGSFKKDGQSAYHVDDQGKPTTHMIEFDPQAGHMAITPAPTVWDRIGGDENAT